MEKFKKLVDQMSTHAQAEYPKESCGLITKDFEYIKCKNISPLPKISFIVDPIALLEQEDNVWAIVHSHPGDDNPIPSENDIKHTVFDEYKFLVGFAGKYYIYWFDKILRYELFEECHVQ